jgi:GAF domain-containing protein
MEKAPIPKDEFKRIVSLIELDLLDTPPEKRFDQLTRCATKIFHVPISTLTLIDAQREWFKSCQGLSATEGDRAISFCGHALVENEILVIPDTTKDKRFADNPMVTGEPYIRFYAGVPIMSADGSRVGVFCIKDTKPREFSEEDGDVLKGLARWAELEINLRNLNFSVQDKFVEKYVKERKKRL